MHIMRLKYWFYIFRRRKGEDLEEKLENYLSKKSFDDALPYCDEAKDLYKLWIADTALLEYDLISPSPLLCVCPVTLIVSVHISIRIGYNFQLPYVHVQLYFVLHPQKEMIHWLKLSYFCSLFILILGHP